MKKTLILTIASTVVVAAITSVAYAETTIDKGPSEPTCVKAVS